ncbi:hypothetical protein CEXT_568701 [Caerostris extrusa]|uniref:Uncharacterized protein n=1 Tax=Caerostris extrusa TaxID=172846 RepID=A0AAV4T2H8_CAEEX|nr:hypothetical protein CEXT_568701 [Caerostris extrusa]
MEHGERQQIRLVHLNKRFQLKSYKTITHANSLRIMNLRSAQIRIVLEICPSQVREIPPVVRNTQTFRMALVCNENECFSYLVVIHANTETLAASFGRKAGTAIVEN